MTYIDEYTIQTIGSKWHKGKEKKNQVLAEMQSGDYLYRLQFHQNSEGLEAYGLDKKV